jgi:hypothetical protein
MPKVRSRSRPWMNATWNVLHTIAEKLNEEHFNKIRSSVFLIIKEMCGNLPCPSCAAHARGEMKKINPEHIKTKKDLKLMLFHFHNRVNERLKKPLFKIEHLDKYQMFNLNDLLKIFFETWTVNYSNPKMMTVNYIKNNFLKKFDIWLIENQMYFSK